MAVSKRRMRDFQRCLRTIQSFSDNQAQIQKWDEDCLEWVEVCLQPKGGYYMGGTFDFKIYFERDYPKTPPRVDCLTPIYHPNIDTTCADYNVCLSLFDSWAESFGLEDVVQGLLFLMYNPNIEDPLSPYFDPDMDEADFQECVELSLRGEEVDGAELFPRNRSETEEGHVEVRIDEDAISRSIDLILEKASRIVLATEPDSDGDAERSKTMTNDEVSDSDNSNNQSTDDTERDHAKLIETLALPADNVPSNSTVDNNNVRNNLQRMDSQARSGCSSDTCGHFSVTDTRTGPQRDRWRDVRRFLSLYVPRTFVSPQPESFLVSAVLVCLEMVVLAKR